MNEHTARSLEKIDALMPLLTTLPEGVTRTELIETTEALRRAVAAFHMEAIRFRMYSVDRLLKQHVPDPTARELFEAVRQELEEAGFHTRSHTAP